MNTNDGQRIEIKFAPTADGWSWNVKAVCGGAVVLALSESFPDKARARKAIKAELKDCGIS